MANFWDKLYTPPPFFTEQNVKDAKEYAEAHPNKYTEIYIDALNYVTNVLRKTVKGSVIPRHDRRIVCAAYDAAKEEHDKAPHNKTVHRAGDIAGATRWWYIMAATQHFIDVLKKMEGLTV